MLLPVWGTRQACGPVATATPTRTVPTRAIENHVHLVYSNFNGNPLPLAGTMCGQSAIIGPDGTDLRRGPGVEVDCRGVAWRGVDAVWMWCGVVCMWMWR